MALRGRGASRQTRALARGRVPERSRRRVTIHSDAPVYAGLFDAGESAKLEPARHAWVQVARGQLRVNGETLSSGDGAALSDVPELHIEGVDRAEILVFELA
ncbi:MAG TPA: hypothetical protein VFN67_12745 [Polyangiales bacterium]|nr:hypothetical protein [Polyangiales bacterium]